MLATGVLLFAFHVALILVDLHWAQLGFAVLNTAIGLVVAWWLRRQGPGERASAVLIVLCGINQFTYVLMGEPGALLQTTIAAALRLLLGMSLMYAALTRTGRSAPA